MGTLPASANASLPFIATLFGNGFGESSAPALVRPARMNSPPPDPQPEAALLGRVANGDTRAFDELYTRWSPMLYGLVCKILNDPLEAEDALQEGFVHIWNKAATYNAARSSPTTWAYMIFRNRAIDRLRARERRGRGVERIAVEEAASPLPAAAPEEGAEQAERRQAVAQAMTGISAEEREAINLAFFSGLTQMEIAERLGAPLGTIKARIRRGLMKLSGVLKGKL